MPTYDYKCPHCGREFTVQVPVVGRNDVSCACGRQAARLPAAPGIAFKGTGFYVTDYKGKP